MAAKQKIVPPMEVLKGNVKKEFLEVYFRGSLDAEKTIRALIMSQDDEMITKSTVLKIHDIFVEEVNRKAKAFV